jgi:hypothetical protein
MKQTEKARKIKCDKIVENTTIFMRELENENAFGW